MDLHRSSLPPKGSRSSPCSAGGERSVRRLQAASLTRGQRCGQGTETGNERQTHTQSPIPRGLSHPRRSGRPSDRAQARSCTPSPHPLQRLPSRASPRELSRSGTSPSQVNTETPGTLQARFFPGGCITHTAERNSLLVGTLGASHRACRTQRVPGRLHACASEPTYRHSPRDGRGFLFFPLVALALPPAQGPLPTFFGPGGGVSVLGRSSRSCSCWGGVRFLPPPCLDW